MIFRRASCLCLCLCCLLSLSGAGSAWLGPERANAQARRGARVAAETEPEVDLGLDSDSPEAASGDAPEASGERPAMPDDPAAEASSAAGAEVSAAEPPVDAPPPAPPPSPSVIVHAFAGLGTASRSFERPFMSGSQVLPNSFVPAVETGMGVIAWPEERFSLAVDLRYQTALGLSVTERPPFALVNEVAVRSERVELTAAPSFWLGDSPRSPRLAVPVGAQIRTFWPEVHRQRTAPDAKGTMTPGYSLLGPHARVELLANLVGPLSLRIGPELQWIVLIDESLRATGVDRMGWAVGAEATLRLELSPTWSLAAHYRESHAFVASDTAVSFEDVERYLTARLVGMF